LSAVGIGSCGDEAAGLNAALSWCRVKADEVQGDVLERGEIVGGMSGASPHLIVGEDNIHAPVQAVLSHPGLKAGDSSIRSWGAFGSLLRFVSFVSAINGVDKRETCVQYSSDRGLPD